MKRITIDFNDDITPMKLSDYIKMLHKHYRDYVKQITIDYFSDMETEEEKKELKIRWKDYDGVELLEKDPIGELDFD
jgi:hypothetical protein